jgi:4-amino-4-deoxy-L-arabinose transferase-like glycosyltransferase
MIKKNNTTKIFLLFLFSHLLIWTAIPFFSNHNLPLDTIEALAWASNLDWGYNKHPPFSAFMVGLFYFIFGSNDWAFYLLSQICILISFYYVWKISKDFFEEKIFPLLAVLILEGLVFFNYTTPEFNVYVCQLPLKAVTIYFFWRGINENKKTNWVLLGIFSALGILTHYSFVFILLSLSIFLSFYIKKNNEIIKNFFLAFAVFLLLIAPHLFWLFENNFITISYAFNRTGIEDKSLIDHIYNPTLFVFKQAGMLVVFFILFISIISFDKKKINFKLNNKKKIFLFSISFLPILMVFLVSVISGAKIRTMWMSTFYLFFGLFFFYILKNKINLKKLNNFIYSFLFIFLLSPAIYLYVSLENDFKRTDFEGKEIARLVQNKWNDNFINEIKVVIGDEWYGGNLSYHLSSRPVWVNDLKNYSSDITVEHGVIYTGNPKILKKICPGVFGAIKPVGYCMIGKK